ncbi:repressor LexA [Lactobacillus colini]|uniref:Repressor LexA n=1 Tax=Lactobacillus colini TaxID=1819254 RepID=A0ABS4MEE0_9LACO|nr:helix-turn-helix domain-containing protein [Lactobacillus colini]MBP2057737.1 repressor LexA [Lactobacillus colini]
MPKTNNPTSKQVQILQYIYDTVEKRKFPPTVREICEAVNLSSTSTVHGHLARLEHKGWLYRDATKPRAIEVTKAGLKELGVKPQVIPIINSSITDLNEAIEKASDFFPIPPQLKKFAGNLFMLKVETDFHNQLLAGDQIIIKKQTSATENDIVIVLNEDNKLSLAHYSKENSTLILGKVISLYRNI